MPARAAIIDSGVLAAAANPNDTANRWSLGKLATIAGPAITCEAAITEAVHLVKNNATAVERLEIILGDMRISELGSQAKALLGDVRRHSPRMDYADACIVRLQKRNKFSYVLTVDHKDFTIYGVPFASPQGAFY